jgi:polysaccharide biosynthesis transport protein
MSSTEPPPPSASPAGASRCSPALVMVHDPRSLHAEQYRAFRTNLTALNRGGGPWVVIVTSSRKGEGKSVTAANIAACLAELPGQRVCLVDVDFRRPTQCNLFAQSNTPGVAELLQDQAPLTQVALPTVVPSLDLIPAGVEPRSPAELLGSERFTSFLSELKRRYSWVLVDTPPVNPYTDACVLANRANGALLVVRMEKTSRDLAQRSLQSIQRAGGKVLGTFLTGMPGDREDSDRMGYYGTGSTSGGPEAEKARREAMKRLKDQEQAWLRQQAAEDRIKGKDREPEV